jgi:hypothetical protein
MASIDKTYTNSFEEYQQLVDWAKDKEIVFSKKQKEKISDCIYNWSKEDFTSELPVMNTPNRIDIFLIQNCPIKFVQDRMEEVYSEESIEEFKAITFPIELPKDYKQNRKIIISKSKVFPLYNKGINSHSWWWLQNNDFDWGFDSDNNVWTNRSLYYPNNTNTSHHKTIKSLVRFLRKQYLPSGLEFRLSGKYVGEEFTIKIK